LRQTDEAAKVFKLFVEEYNPLMIFIDRSSKEDLEKLKKTIN
jgi:hypothetical protein